MFTLIRAAVRSPLLKPVSASSFSSVRCFGTLLLRPTVLPRVPAGLSQLPTTTTGATDTVAARISASPALQALQVRNGPRDTFDPSHRVRKRRHGFLSRIKKRTGRATLKRRQLKGRKSLSH